MLTFDGNQKLDCENTGKQCIESFEIENTRKNREKKFCNFECWESHPEVISFFASNMNFILKKSNHSKTCLLKNYLQCRWTFWKPYIWWKSKIQFWKNEIKACKKMKFIFFEVFKLSKNKIIVKLVFQKKLPAM